MNNIFDNKITKIFIYSLSSQYHKIFNLKNLKKECCIICLIFVGYQKNLT